MAHLIIVFHTTYYSTELLSITSALRVMTKEGGGSEVDFQFSFIVSSVDENVSYQEPLS